ncbi:hypothetical protein ACQ4PT_023946 [Festuca glaucescens]
MSISDLLFLLTLVLLVAGDGGLAVGTRSPLMTKTYAAIYNLTGVSKEDCVGALSADPAAASAKGDTREFAVVAANLTAANVTSTVLFLADLVHNLQACLSIYREMDDTLAATLHEFRAGHVDTASEKLSVASLMPDDCRHSLVPGKRQEESDEQGG